MLMFCALTAHANPITVDNFLSPDDVTISHLEQFRTSVVNAINNADGGLLQARTVTPEKLTKNADVTIFRDEAFNDWIFSGFIIPTSASLISTTPIGTAYVGGQRIEKDATIHTYTASKWTWVDLKSDGTYVYTEGTIGDADPAIANNTVRLARVSSDGTTINAIRDDRILSITLENRQADFYRKSLQMRGSNATTDVVQVMPGVVYWGNVRIGKATMTTLGLGTAGDWITGQSAADNTMGFVVTNNAGSIKLSTTAPTYHDLAGTTIGTRYYSLVGGNYYRVLAWFYMSDDWDASIKINPWEWGNLGADTVWKTFKQLSTDQVTTTGGWQDVGDTLMNFYSSGGGVSLSLNATGYSTTQHFSFDGCIELDGLPLEETAVSNSSTATTYTYGGAGASMFTKYVTPELLPGNHTFRANWRQTLGYTAHILQVVTIAEGN